jgi:hypothetical protein
MKVIQIPFDLDLVGSKDVTVEDTNGLKILFIQKFKNVLVTVDEEGTAHQYALPPYPDYVSIENTVFGKLVMYKPAPLTRKEWLDKNFSPMSSGWTFCEMAFNAVRRGEVTI